MPEYLGIEIDYDRDRIIPQQGLVMLTKKGFYKKEWENSPQESYARAATCFSFGDLGLAQRIYDAVSKQHFTFASPVLSNAEEILWPEGLSWDEAGEWLEDCVNPASQPISCFLNAVFDNKQSLVETSNETRWLSMNGGGVGTYFGNRAPDEKSTGVMAHAKGYDSDTKAYRQTATRRGSIAAYMDIDHPEIMSFIQMRNPVGGDTNSKCFNLNNGVNITDSFMEAMILGTRYELVDPKHGATGRYLDAQEVWDLIMDMRYETGEPYINFIDTVNRGIPSWITKPLYRVRQSNLCSEIALMTSPTRTAVCCLSSLNIETYEEWKDTTLVADLTRFLDNVLEYFIRTADPETLGRAINSATKERALGIGTLGWHSFLQSKRIPMESGGFNSAVSYSHRIYGDIKAKAVAESKVLASERGEAPDCRDSGMRNSHLMAIAPNASSSSLVNTSPSTEPWAANAFSADGRAGSFLIKNKYLKEELEARGLDTPEMWKRIILDNGSIADIEELEDIHDIFKTSFEVDPIWLIELAAIRQEYVCQSQSTNLFFAPGTTRQQMSDIHVLAWVKRVKSLYYCRSDAPVKANVSGVKQPLNKVGPDECLSCHG